MREAENYCSDVKYDLCVRRSQDAVEMFLKSLFLSINKEFPRIHDLKKKLYEIHEALKDYITPKETAQMIIANDTLALWRERALYGDEILKVSNLFGEQEANLALAYVKRIHGLVVLARYKLALKK